MMTCSPMLGEFIRAERPLTIQDLMDAYKLSRPRVMAELSEMFNAGHIEQTPSGALRWTVTAKGREDWATDDDE